MNLLHLEDSSNDAALAASLLHSEWPDCCITHVTRRTDYQTALELGAFDLILSDYATADYDGLAALEAARTCCPEKPFIFMSGTLGEERAIEALQNGATDYIVKDRPGRLVPAIRQALTRAEENGRRHRTEEALRQNRERFRQITENVADMISVLDLEGHRIYQNPACIDLVGAGSDKPAFDDIHPDDRARVRALFAEIARNGGHHRVEYRLLLPDESVHHLEAQGSVIRDSTGQIAHILLVARDITENKQAEAHIRAQANLLDKARDAICVQEVGLGITFWNKSAERLYGWTALEAFGQDVFTLLAPSPPSAPQEDWRGATLTRGEWAGEIRHTTKDGRELIVESRLTLIRDDEDRPKSILLINTDVTEQRALATRLERNQRLESIGSLTGGIAHDLNNMLSPILMGSQLLAHTAADEATRKTVAAIETSALHGTALVRQLLSFARGTEGERTLVQIDDFFADLQPLLRHSLPRSIKLSVNAAHDCWPVLADATQLKQVALNLCINARDAMPEGGEITIDAENVFVDSDLAQAWPDAHPGAHLRINVTDTGCGMPPAVLEKIFDPFFTTKSPGQGTGLGLSTVCGIAKGHGGFIQVESRPGHGTSFRFHLPVLRTLDNPSPPPVSSPASNLLPVGEGEAILVLNDEPAMRDLMRSLLHHHGYHTYTTADTREGVEKLNTSTHRLAAVIADLHHPTPDGEALITALRKISPAIPVVAIADYPNPSPTLAPFPPPGFAALLAKPIDTPAFLGTLRSVIHPNTSLVAQSII